MTGMHPLKKWRKDRRLSQDAMAFALEALAKEKFPTKEVSRLPQRTYAYWETGVTPRKFWLGIIKDYTKGEITSGAWVV